MADYIAQQEAELAKASRNKRDTDQQLEIASARYDTAKENTAGAGRGKQGGPTAKELSSSKKYAKGGSVSSASKRADGIAQRGKTRGSLR